MSEWTSFDSRSAESHLSMLRETAHDETTYLRISQERLIMNENIANAQRKRQQAAEARAAEREEQRNFTPWYPWGGVTEAPRFTIGSHRRG